MMELSHCMNTASNRCSVETIIIEDKENKQKKKIRKTMSYYRGIHLKFEEISRPTTSFPYQGAAILTSILSVSVMLIHDGNSPSR
jgi:hypothetical protein